MRVETKAMPLIGVLAMLLAACQPAAETLEPVPVAPEAVPGTGPALEQMEPDLCGAREFIPYLTLPVSALDTAQIDRPYRVIEWRGIVTQEYDPNRLVFRLDPQGNIYNVDCG